MDRNVLICHEYGKNFKGIVMSFYNKQSYLICLDLPILGKKYIDIVMFIW